MADSSRSESASLASRDMNADEWRAKLGEEGYRVMRQSGTERPFSGSLWEESRAGKYYCRGIYQILIL